MESVSGSKGSRPLDLELVADTKERKIVGMIGGWGRLG